MRLGRYTLAAPGPVGPAGPIFAATADDGAGWEVRLLDRARSDPAAWPALSRRLRLLTLLEHPAVLRPIEVDLDHDPPYLIVPADRPPTASRSESAAEVAIALTAALADAHRVGLTFGRPGPHVLRQAADGRLLLDFSDTGDGSGTDAGDPAADVARLGDLLDGLFAPPPGQSDAADGWWAEWRAVLGKLRAADPADRPRAEEAAGWFRGLDPGQTHDSAVADLAATSSEPVEPAGPAGGVLKPGDRIGRFRLAEKLGEGGMGTVFRGVDESDGAAVAVKVLRPGLAASPQARSRFVKEGRMLAAVDTPFVARLVEANTDGGHCYLALEYVPGASLGARLRAAGRFDEATALGYIADAARGLAAAHAVGIVHRDLKPDNLLVAEGGDGPPRVKVTDFGLARAVAQTESLDLTQAGAVLGTPLYMSPEQFGAGPVDPRADVYSLEATLFHLLAGRPPFPLDSLAALAKAVASDPPPAVDRLNPAVSAATAAFVARCLAKAPADRAVDAAAFLRDVDRLRGGEPAVADTHPRGPVGSAAAREYVFRWELDSPPARLWPYVSNTERLNRAAGLPAVRYTVRRDPHLGTRRFAAARVNGFRMEWEEHPFEWVEGRRMGVLREFSRRPFAWFLSVVDLQPRPGGGTTLRQTLRAEPRGLLGRVAVPVEVGFKAKRSLGKVYRRIDALLSGSPAADPAADPFEVPTQLSRPRQRRLRAGIDRLVVLGASPEAADILGLYLGNAPDQEAGRIRPLALARRFAVDETGMVEACLRAVGQGLLGLHWDIICPLCRIPSGRKDTLRDLREHETCQACDAAFPVNFAEAVELVFAAHPDIRPAEAGTYCAGGPAHSPHVVAQTRVGAGERVEVPLALSEGVYRLRGPQLPWSLELRVAAGAAVRQWEVELAAAHAEAAPPLAPGGQVLTLRNGRPYDVIARVERTAARDDALTAARATALPVFRELFPGELLSPGQLAPATVATFLLVQIDGGEELYSERGEADAFRLIQAVFRVVEERVRAGGGTVVKSVGETVVAAFGELTAAVRTALGLREVLAADPLAGGARVRAAVHRGPTMIATVNDRLDYHGQTVKLAERLLAAARPGHLLLSAAAAGDPEAEALLRGRPVRLVEVPRAAHGRVLAYHVPL